MDKFMIKNILTAIMLVVFLTACKSSLMEPVTEQQITNVPQEQARVVFIRSSFFGQAIQSSVYDVTDGTPKFIGIISNDTQVVFDSTPGEKMFMVVGESADFLKATLDKSETYYAVVTPRMGVWKARFSLHPVRNKGTEAKFYYGSDEFKKMLKAATYATAGEKAMNWAVKNQEDIQEKYAEYLPDWKSKSAEKIQQATINKADHL